MPNILLNKNLLTNVAKYTTIEVQKRKDRRTASEKGEQK